MQLLYQCLCSCSIHFLPLPLPPPPSPSPPPSPFPPPSFSLHQLQQQMQNNPFSALFGQQQGKLGKCDDVIITSLSLVLLTYSQVLLTQDQLLHRGPQTLPPCQTLGLPLARQLLEQQEHPRQQRLVVLVSHNKEERGKGSSPELELELGLELGLGLAVRHSRRPILKSLGPCHNCHQDILM